MLLGQLAEHSIVTPLPQREETLGGVRVDLEPICREAHVFHRWQDTQHLSERHTLSGGNIFKNFRVPVLELFLEPAWWTDKRQPASQKQ